MPIDPRIALGTQTPQMRSPITTLGAISQLREHQGLVEQRRLANEQRQRELEDDDAIHSTLQRTGNPDTAIEELYRSGRPNAASVLSKQVYEWRDAKVKAMKEEQDIASNNFKMLTQIANSVTDQKTLDTARPAARALLVPVLGEEQADAMLSQLGTEYDEDKIKQARAWGTSTSDLLSQQKEAREKAEKAIEIGRGMIKDGIDRDKARREADKYWSEAAGGFLSTARSQEQWDGFQRTLMLGGAPAATLARFGNQYSPEAAARAKTLGMTPKEAEEVRHQKADEGIAQANLDERRLENSGGPHTRPLTATARKDVEKERANAFAALEKELRAAYPGDSAATVGEIPDDHKPQIAARKLQIEDAYREKLGLKPLAETELELAADPSKKQELQKIRFTYRKLTGDDTPLAKMETLQKQIKDEKDSAKREALKQQLVTLRTAYREQMGR